MSPGLIRSPNIGPSGRRRRLRIGVIFLALSLAALVTLVLSTAGPWSRLVLFPLFWTGFIGVFEARSGTCVIHAVRGTCERDQQEAFGRDSEAAAVNRGRNQRLLVQTTVLAGIATVIAMMV